MIFSVRNCIFSTSFYFLLFAVFLFSGVQVVSFYCLKVFILRDGASVTEKTIQVAENKNLRTKENKNLYTAENVFIICLQVLFSTSFYFLFAGFNHLVYESFYVQLFDSFYLFSVIIGASCYFLRFEGFYFFAVRWCEYKDFIFCCFQLFSVVCKCYFLCCLQVYFSFSALF